ncbi:MAG TPA: hypothetical protein VFE99_03190, partial [Agromyces sp.]|nr:hypothetical protein [Agromyces sp.]
THRSGRVCDERRVASRSSVEHEHRQDILHAEFLQRRRRLANRASSEVMSIEMQKARLFCATNNC